MKIIIFLFRDLIEHQRVNRHSEFNFVTGPDSAPGINCRARARCAGSAGLPTCKLSVSLLSLFPDFLLVFRFPQVSPNNLSISRSLSLHNYRRSFICNSKKNAARIGQSACDPRTDFDLHAARAGRPVPWNVRKSTANHFPTIDCALPPTTRPRISLLACVAEGRCTCQAGAVTSWTKAPKSSATHIS